MTGFRKRKTPYTDKIEQLTNSIVANGIHLNRLRTSKGYRVEPRPAPTPREMMRQMDRDREERRKLKAEEAEWKEQNQRGRKTTSTNTSSSFMQKVRSLLKR